MNKILILFIVCLAYKYIHNLIYQFYTFYTAATLHRYLIIFVLYLIYKSLYISVEC